MENIEKIIKVNPEDIAYIFRFVSNAFSWDKNWFLKIMENVVRKRTDNRNLFLVRIKPKYLLVPVYSYFFATDTVMKDLGFTVAYEDIIEVEKISQFKVYRVPDMADVTISLIVRPSIGGFSGTKVEILGIRFSIKHKLKENDKVVDISVYFGHKRDYELLEMELQSLRESQGKSFYNLANFIDPRVAREIYGVEKSMFIISNFIYALYTGEYVGEFGKEDPQTWILRPFVEVLKGYGETFEGVLEAIKVASAFIV